jgi:hypothetical protein
VPAGIPAASDEVQDAQHDPHGDDTNDVGWRAGQREPGPVGKRAEGAQDGQPQGYAQLVAELRQSRGRRQPVSAVL